MNNEPNKILISKMDYILDEIIADIKSYSISCYNVMDKRECKACVDVLFDEVINIVEEHRYHEE